MEVGGVGAEVPDEAGPGEGFQGVIGDVDFPPVEALRGGHHVVVMIVVPAFAQGDEGQQEAVAAVVIGLEASFSEEMGQGVDGGGGVEQRGGADEESPDEQLPAVRAEGGEKMVQHGPGDEQSDGEKNWDHRIKAIEPNEFRIFGEVAHASVVGGKIPRATDPPNMSPPESVLPRRVGVVFLVGMLVMMAMLLRPPQGAALDGGGADDREAKLRKARGLESAMGKIAVIKSGDGEHSDHIKRERGYHCCPTPTHPNKAQATDVQTEEGKAAYPIDAIGLCFDFRDVAVAKVRVKPLHDGNKTLAAARRPRDITHELLSKNCYSHPFANDDKIIIAHRIPHSPGFHRARREATAGCAAINKGFALS